MTETTGSHASLPWWESLSPATLVVHSKLDELGIPQIDALLVLGSGMGDIVKRWKPRATWRPAALPGAPVSTVDGHPGLYHLVPIGHRWVLVQQGRVHVYENGRLDDVLFAVRLGYRLGAEWLVLTNAAGGVDPTLEPGTLLILEDHISILMGQAFGATGARLTPRREGRSAGSPYDPAWVRRLIAIAVETGIPARRGILAGGLGPAYETAAEVEALRRLGAHAATMSTVLEALEGRALGLRVAGISFISNMATGLSRVELTHAEVIALGRRASSWIGELLEKALELGPDDPPETGLAG